MAHSAWWTYGNHDDQEITMNLSFALATFSLDSFNPFSLPPGIAAFVHG
jgi:hypothetical protein